MSEFHYSLRVTTKDQKSLIGLLEKYSSESIFSREEGSATGKVHYHCYMTSVTKDATLRKAIRTKFNPENLKELKGNALYSLKNLDERLPLEYCSYMIKEGEYKFINVPEEKQKAIEDYQAVVKKQIKEKKERKKNKMSNMCAFIKEYIENKDYLDESLRAQPRPPGLMEDPAHVRKIIAMGVLEFQLSENLQVNINMMRTYVNTVMCKLYPQFKYVIIEQMLKFE